LTHPLVHDLEHVLYLLAGYLFYLPLLGSEPIRWRLSFPARLLVLVASMPVDTFVGVVLTQTNRELFPAYTAAHRAWGPSLIDDLHAGGGVMWVGGDGLMLLFIVLASVVFARDARGTAGRWLETARRNTLAEHGAAPPSARPRPVDDDEQQLAAYNAYLADLARGRRRGPV
jgi:putative copper resistance protein D